jgi:hypothetical protein
MMSPVRREEGGCWDWLPCVEAVEKLTSMAVDTLEDAGDFRGCPRPPGFGSHAFLEEGGEANGGRAWCETGFGGGADAAEAAESGGAMGSAILLPTHEGVHLP